jgi:hypothetical protein
MKGNSETEQTIDDTEWEPWETCWDCAGDGYIGHDCGEDCCACLHPEDNVMCSTCDGEGGWPEVQK